MFLYNILMCHVWLWSDILCLDFLMCNKEIRALMSPVCANRFYPLSSTVLLNATVCRFGLNPSYVTLLVDDVRNFLCVFCHMIFLPFSCSSWLPSLSYFAMECAVTPIFKLWQEVSIVDTGPSPVGGCQCSCISGIRDFPSNHLGCLFVSCLLNSMFFWIPYVLIAWLTFSNFWAYTSVTFWVRHVQELFFESLKVWG